MTVPAQGPVPDDLLPFGWVDCGVIDVVGDDSSDDDQDPGSRPVSGAGLVVFTPKEVTRRVMVDGRSTLVRERPVKVDLDANGVLELAGHLMVKLWHGVWTCSPGNRNVLDFGAFDFQVGDQYTLESPCPLWHVAPFEPPAGVTVTTLVVPSGGAAGQILGWSGARLAWMSLDADDDTVPDWADLGTLDPAVTVPLSTAEAVECTLAAATTIAVTGTSGSMLLLPTLNGHTLTVTGVDWQTDADTTTGALVLIGTPSRILCWPVGAVPAAPDTTPPTWSGTLTTGTPTDTAVDVTASALAADDKAVTGYQWRAGAADSWRSITPDGTVFHITGLSASTAYAAPQMRAYDAAGNFSPVLSGQAFTTASAAAGWNTLWSDDFEGATADASLAGRTTPVGGRTWVLAGDAGTKADAQIRPAGVVQLKALTLASPNVTAIIPGSNADQKLRLTLDYAPTGDAGVARVGFAFSGNNQPQRYNVVGIHTGTGNIGALGGDATGFTFTETSGLTGSAPTTGTAVLTIDGTIITLEIGGTLMRQWTVAWGANASIAYSGLYVVGSGLTPPAWAPGVAKSITCEVWS